MQAAGRCRRGRAGRIAGPRAVLADALVRSGLVLGRGGGGGQPAQAAVQLRDEALAQALGEPWQRRLRARLAQLRQHRRRQAPEGEALRRARLQSHSTCLLCIHVLERTMR